MLDRAMRGRSTRGLRPTCDRCPHQEVSSNRNWPPCPLSCGGVPKTRWLCDVDGGCEAAQALSSHPAIDRLMGASKTDDYDAAVQIKHMPEVERG